MINLWLTVKSPCLADRERTTHWEAMGKGDACSPAIISYSFTDTLIQSNKQSMFLDACQYYKALLDTLLWLVDNCIQSVISCIADQCYE